MKISSVSYTTLSTNTSNELFKLRKNVFKDRLNWAVTCSNNMEIDEYDNQYATYIMAVHDNLVMGCLRMIDMEHPTLFTGPFRDTFNLTKLPAGKSIECSRSFVDKVNTQNLSRRQYPVSMMLYLAVLNYAMDNDYDHIVAILSHAALKILGRTGLQINIIEEEPSEKNEPIYFVSISVNRKNQAALIVYLNKNNFFEGSGLTQWPVKFIPVVHVNNTALKKTSINNSIKDSEIMRMPL